MERKTELLNHKKMLERIAVCIHRNIFAGNELPETGFYKTAKEYESGTIGNFQFHQSWNTAVEVYGLMTESEMSDMIQEMEEEQII